MARRQSNGGSTAPIYEDFQPISEQKEEQGAHLLYIRLPGFSKEQVRVIYINATRIIRVQGQRPLGTNKWSRFNQTFNVPQNCSVEKIHGKFQEGIMTIIIPKQIIEPPQPAAAPKQEGTKITPREKEPSSVPGPLPKEPSPSKQPSSMTVPPPIVPSSVTAPPSKVPSLVTTPPSKEPSLIATPPQKVPSSVVAPPPKEPSPVTVPPPPPPPPSKVPSSIAVPPSKPAAPAQLPQGETTRKDQETSPAFQTPQKPTIGPKVQEQGDTFAKASPKQSTEKEDSQTKDKEKKDDAPPKAPYDSRETMKTALERREDRHLIVNVGVAVLVIVAVGAYVTYKIRSSGKLKD